MAATKFQQLVKAKAGLCKGRTTKSAVKKKASAYVKHSVTKLGKTATPKERKAARTKALSVAKKVMNRGCSTSTYIGKRRRSKKRK